MLEQLGIGLVVAVGAFGAGGHQADVGQAALVVRHRRAADTEGGGELLDGVRRLRERSDQSRPIGVGEGFDEGEHLGVAGGHLSAHLRR